MAQKKAQTKKKKPAAPKKAAGKKTVRKVESKKKKPGQPKAKRKNNNKQPFLTPEYNFKERRQNWPFNQKVADEICGELATTSKSLARVLHEREDWPGPTTIYKWLRECEAFAKQYARAKEDQADMLAEEIIEIADNNRFDREAFVGINHIQRAKLMVDSRKFIAAKLKPKKYGDKLDLTSDGEKIEPVVIYMPDNGRKNTEVNKGNANG